MILCNTFVQYANVEKLSKNVFTSMYLCNIINSSDNQSTKPHMVVGKPKPSEKVVNMNKQQKNYMKDKAILETLESQEKEIESQWIISNGIKNSDGSIPKYTWTIENDEIANKAIDDFGNYIESIGLWGQILKARENLKNSENALCDYAISIIPFKKERDALGKAILTNFSIRQKIIDSVFRLDTKTVTKIYK